MAPSLRVDLSPVDARDVSDMERALTDFARQPNGGVIVTLSGASTKHRNLIITLTNQYRLPAVYAERYYRRRRRNAQPAQGSDQPHARERQIPGRKVPENLSAERLQHGGQPARI